MAVINTDSNQGNALFQQLADNLEKAVSPPRGATRAQQNGVIRTPWTMTTTEWLTDFKPPKVIQWAANPGDIAWSMPQRSTHSKNMSGTVMHVWPDSARGTFYDEFRLSLNLQSGNLMPILIGDTGKYQASDGIQNFYEFMQLVDAPKLTGGKRPRTNLVHISYYSPLFPQLTLLGMFDSSGIKFNDSAEHPNQVVSWSAEFIVYDTIPRITDNSGQPNNLLLAKWVDVRINKGKLPLPNDSYRTPQGSGSAGTTTKP